MAILRKACPSCGGDIFDNRADIANGKGPKHQARFKCKRRDECGWSGKDDSDIANLPPIETAGRVGHGAQSSGPVRVGYTWRTYLLTARRCWDAAGGMVGPEHPQRSSVFSTLLIGAQKEGLVWNENGPRPAAARTAPAPRSAPAPVKPPAPEPARQPAAQAAGNGGRPAEPKRFRQADPDPEFDGGDENDDLPF